MNIEFLPGLLTIKMQDNEKDAPVLCEVHASIAKETGLAYHASEDCEGHAYFTLIHIASGTRVGAPWQVSTEAEARAWLLALHELIDWTLERPRVRPEMRGEVVLLATIGALHNLPEELPSEESEEE